MTSSDENSSQMDSPVTNVPEVLVFEVPGIQQLVEDLFPLTSRDRDDLVRQIFDHFLNLNSFDVSVPFQPRLELLDLDLYQLRHGASSMGSLQLLAQNIFSRVCEQLAFMRIHQVVEAQQGFYYVLDQVRSNGSKIVLKNISPDFTSKQRRYDPTLYP